jgi:hypothetical protein
MINMTGPETYFMEKQSRDAQIDIIKAISIVLVLLWHIQPIPGGLLPQNSLLSDLGREIIRLFYFRITLLAVPIFILVSLYLFIKKMAIDGSYWKTRLWKLMQIYIFWVGIQFILYLITGGPLPLPLNTIIPGGGPPLPYVGASVLYFLFILILCTIWSTLFLKIPERFRLILSIIVIGLSCLHFVFAPRYGIGLDTVAMENYYIYIPIAYYLQNYKEKLSKYRVYLITAFFITAFYEEYLWSTPLSAYGRLSTVFGVLSLVSIFISGKFTAYRSVEFLARYSLGIFALHRYFQYLCIFLLAIYRQKGLLIVPSVMQPMLIFIVVVTLSCITSYLMGKTKMRIYVA